MEEEKLTRKERRALKKQQKIEKESQKEKKLDTQKYIRWGIGIALLIGLGFFLKMAFTVPAPGTIPELQIINESDQVKGATESAKLLIEYSDYQCPACRQYFPVIEQFIAEKGDQFTFVYRHFPLAQHKNAEAASHAAEAAGKQGKFWKMHRLLFERQDMWSVESNPDESFLSYAKELEIDIDQFSNDYNSPEVKDKVTADLNSGIRHGVNSTPTFYFNGEKINPRSLDDFNKLVE